MEYNTHDAYGKAVLARAAGNLLDASNHACRVDYGGPCRTGGFIDGTVGGRVAVEIESRVSKQVRGAVLDLICHEYPGKLLLLLDVHQHNVELTKSQCDNALRRFVEPDRFAVVVLSGSAKANHFDDDVLLVRKALTQLDSK